MNEVLSDSRAGREEHAPVAFVVAPSGTTADPETSLAGVVPLWLDRGKRWAGIFAAYFSTQTVTQLAGVVAGLLLVNFMPVREYALYTLAMSVVAFFTFVTDLGATSSLLYFSREAKQAGEPFEPFVAAVLSLRWPVFAVGAVAVLAGFPLIAVRKQFSLTPALLVGVVIVVMVGLQVLGSVHVLVLRLTDKYGRSYRAELASGVTRLGVVAVMIAGSLLFAWIGVLANALAAGALVLVAGSALATPAGGSALAPYRRKVVRYLLPTLPSALYFSIQGPLVVWLAATFGGTRNIAEVGALGRLGLIIGLFSGLSGVVFLPRLSAISDSQLYLRRCLQFAIALGGVAFVVFAAAAVMPEVFLLLLGPTYRGLHRELLLIVATSCLTLLGGYLVSVNMARCWTRWQGLAALILAIAQAAFVASLPLGTTSGVLVFGLLTALLGLSLQLATSLTGFVRPELVRWS